MSPTEKMEGAASHSCRDGKNGKNSHSSFVQKKLNENAFLSKKNFLRCRVGSLGVPKKDHFTRSFSRKGTYLEKRVCHCRLRLQRERKCMDGEGELTESLTRYEEAVRSKNHVI